MKSLSSLLSLTLVSFLSLSLTSSSLSSSFLTPVSALNPIAIQGNQLIDSVTGFRFFARGVGYDYMIDNVHIDDWKPAIDILLADSPSTNVLRTYIMDVTQDYDLFMNYAASRGLYILVSLTAGDGCGNLPRGGVPDLGVNTCYPSCLLSFGQAVVNLFTQYDNTLAYVVANEVMNDDATWQAAPCVKAYGRDIKTYLSTCGLRKVPLIYTAADNPIQGYTPEGNDRLKADFLSCGIESQALDMFGLNMFRWCGDTCTYASCGYQQVNDALSGMGIPTLLTEYGCGQFVYGNGVFGIRSFKDTAVLYNEMGSVFSGGAAYTYGVRGGYDFSFFNGGSQDPAGFTGLNKTCGYTITGDQCAIDLYSQELTSTLSSTANNLPATTSPPRLATCPTQVLGFDLTLPPTRQGADGYYFVQCPSGSGNVNTGNSPPPPATWTGFGTTGAVTTGGVTTTPPTSTPTTVSASSTAGSGNIAPTSVPSTDGALGSTGVDGGALNSTGVNGGVQIGDLTNSTTSFNNNKNGAAGVAPIFGMVVGLVAAVVLGL